MENNLQPKPYPDWLDLFLLNSLTIGVIVLIFFTGGCGTGIGNPFTEAEGAGNPTFAPSSEDSAHSASLDFDGPTDDFAANTGAQTCGSFTTSSTVTEIDVGRQCVIDALASCEESKFLLDQTNSENKRFVSYVAVQVTSSNPPECRISIHAVSEDPSKFSGDREKTCTTLDAQDPVELACNIAE